MVRLWPLVCVVSLVGACRSIPSKDTKTTKTGSVYGVFSSGNQVTLKVPTELNGLTPARNLDSASGLKGRLSGLKLAEGEGGGGVQVPLPEQSAVQPSTPGSGAPVTSAGVEKLALSCFTKDSRFIAKGWYFYAELLSSGSVIKSYNRAAVDGCNEMQLGLENLDKKLIYVVKAAFYWQDEQSKQTVVWYEGQTPPFKPGDRDIGLALQPQRVDQNVNIDLAKSERDACIAKNYLWNGIRCLDGFSALSFSQADFSDYSLPGASANGRSRKCLQLGPDGKAIQYSCDGASKQRLRPVLHGTQSLGTKLAPTEYGWFTLAFEGDKTCLTAKKEGPNTTSLVGAPCPTGVPPLTQLFTLIATGSNDTGARNSFRLMNQADGESRCVSVPPEAGDKTGVAPIRDGAPVRLTLCADENAYTRRSQFVRLIEAND